MKLCDILLTDVSAMCISLIHFHRRRTTWANPEWIQCTLFAIEKGIIWKIALTEVFVNMCVLNTPSSYQQTPIQISEYRGDGRGVHQCGCTAPPCGQKENSKDAEFGEALLYSWRRDQTSVQAGRGAEETSPADWLPETFTPLDLILISDLNPVGMYVW